MAKTGGTASGRAAVAKIVKKATGKDVKTWFADLAPEATFLGRPIRPSSPGEPPGVQLDATLAQRLPTLKAWKDAQTAPPPVAKGKKKAKKHGSPPVWAEHVTESDWWHTTLKADKKQSRSGDFKYGANPANSGFMTLHEEVVQALVAAGLSWGGTYSAEKDIMHFDFRSGSIGQAAGAPVV